MKLNKFRKEKCIRERYNPFVIDKASTAGITLIALVVTIIVLIILAGVTIATLTGENGLISKAKQARAQSEIADIIEKAQIDILGVQAQNNGNITESQVNEIISKYGTVSGEGENKIITTESGYEIKASDIWDTTLEGEVVEIATFNRGVGKIDILFLKGATYEVGEANKPKIDSENMIPLNWNGENWVVTDEENWDYSYDETNKKWANVMLSDGTYKAGSVTVGQVVEESDLGSMLVWIPRYAYKISYYESTLKYVNEGEMQLSQEEFGQYADLENNLILGQLPLYKEEEVDLEDNTLGEAIVLYSYDAETGMYNLKMLGLKIQNINEENIMGYSDARGIVDAEGKTPEGMNAPVTSISVGDNYRPHPAFEDGSNTGYTQGEWSSTITGIWMGKFETTGKVNGKITIKPNTESYVNQTIGTFYSEAQDLGVANSHMAKNSEWGAMAYLTESKYGRNGEQVTENLTNQITGQGDYVTNVSLSTTGNIYGIYDTSGGTGEYTASYIADSTSEYANSFASTDNTTNNKIESTPYSTVYANTESNDYRDNYEANINTKFGDGIIETSETVLQKGWHSVRCAFPGYGHTDVGYTYSFCDRGGDYLNNGRIILFMV